MANWPQHIFLFGLAGSGKNFVGDLLTTYGYSFYDADADLTPELHAAIAAGKEFTDAERDNFFNFLRSDRLPKLLAPQKPLCVAQAAYKQRHRDLIQNAFPNFVFIQVETKTALHLQRLKSRAVGIPKDYAQRIQANFEPPAMDCLHLNNDRNKLHLIKQLSDYFGVPRANTVKKPA